MQLMYDTFFRGTKGEAELTAQFGSYVDVRDVAKAHVLAIQKPEAGGSRYVVAAGVFTWQDICK